MKERIYAPEVLSLEQSTRATIPSGKYTMEESRAGAVESGELRFTEQWGCVKHCGDRCPTSSARWHWVRPQKGDDMWRKNKIYLVTKVATFQGEGAERQSTARHKDPTPFQFCLLRGWMQREKWWKTISLSCHQSHECFSMLKTFSYVSAAVCRNHTIFATLVLAIVETTIIYASEFSSKCAW